VKWISATLSQLEEERCRINIALARHDKIVKFNEQLSDLPTHQALPCFRIKNTAQAEITTDDLQAEFERYTKGDTLFCNNLPLM
jgi:hypothetical protein